MKTRIGFKSMAAAVIAALTMGLAPCAQADAVCDFDEFGEGVDVTGDTPVTSKAGFSGLPAFVEKVAT